MAHDNITLLTTAHDAIAAKKRAKHAQIKEIVFDDDARRTFLTGFHKRKTARREEAKKKAQLREKQERLETRREHRRALAERSARNAAEVERACGAFAEVDGDDWAGVSSEPEGMEAEYEGEEQLATVTVVQDFDLTTLLHGPPPTRGPVPAVDKGEEVKRARRKKTPKVKYETKAARRTEQRRQRARRTEKAERAR
ncbi:nucleolar protein 12-domain-containing protein [Boletus edulis BED1]|uniref:Nucleolar protein 12-domain-containing protein n=1 Tax=Boletus edulis BED1 TaxID=1328754 RepID=A0AAD4BZW0_BOLED|nr:nucleolar protein 12-domain-containing protein [Boletus edulis BED1]